jgi:hypothetical protein
MDLKSLAGQYRRGFGKRICWAGGSKRETRTPLNTEIGRAQEALGILPSPDQLA